MAVDNERGPLFRPIVPNQHSRVTYAELFFDLVFVFAVTQVSHTLLSHFTPLGAQDVALSAKMLHLANSSFFGISRRAEEFLWLDQRLRLYATRHNSSPARLHVVVPTRKPRDAVE